MRIIAGKFRSRILKSLKGEALRPTSDRLRVTLFDVLGNAVAGSRFLDVFAGTGAVGIEALSRGAVEAIFIEKHTPAAKLIGGNLDSLGITQGATILTGDALAAMEGLAGHFRSPIVEKQISRSARNDRRAFLPVEERFRRSIDFVFVDPPYAAHEEYSRTLEFLASDSATFLAPDALIIFEHHHKFSLQTSRGRLARTRVLKQGDAALSFYRFSVALARFT